MIANEAVRHGKKFIRDTKPVRSVVLCPFHEERTASCVIAGDRFHCLSCGSRGSVADVADESVWGENPIVARTL